MKNGIAVVALCTLLQAGLYAQDPKPSPTEPGDVVKIWIEKIGTLSNKMA